MNTQLNIFGGSEPVRSFEQDAYGFLVAGYGDKYAIRDGGHVTNIYTGKQIVIQSTKKGYMYVSLWHKERAYSRFVHRLLMQSVTGISGAGLEVNHIDGNKANNTIANLEWVTSSQNKIHSFHILKNRIPILCKGKENPNSKPIEGFDINGNVIVRFASAECARSAGFQPASIAHAISGKLQKRHKGLYWRHAVSDKAMAFDWVGI